MNFSFTPVHLEELLVLLDERVLGLRENIDKRFIIELVQRGEHGQATNELGDEPELEEVFGLDLLEELAELVVFLALDLGAEPERLLADAALHDLLEADMNAPPQMNKDVGSCRPAEKLLLRVACGHPFGGTLAIVPLDDLEQCLLHALARHVARRDAGVVCPCALILSISRRCRRCRAAPRSTSWSAF